MKPYLLLLMLITAALVVAVGPSIEPAWGNPHAPIRLAAGTVSLTPASEFFGKFTYEDPPKNETFTLTNNGASSITISSVDTTGEFGIYSRTCGTSLGAFASCSIIVTFNPDVPVGTYTGTLTVSDSATNSPQTSALKATVVCPKTGC